MVITAALHLAHSNNEKNADNTMVNIPHSHGIAASVCPCHKTLGQDSTVRLVLVQASQLCPTKTCAPCSSPEQQYRVTAGIHLHPETSALCPYVNTSTQQLRALLCCMSILPSLGPLLAGKIISTLTKWTLAMMS